MIVLEKEAKTKEDAVNQAVQELNLSGEEDLDIINVLSSVKKNGFLGIGNNTVVKIKVMKFEELESNILNEFEKVLKLAGFDVKYTKITDFNDNVYEIEFDSDDAALLIGKRGKTLESLQFLLNLIVNRKYKTDDKPIKIILDVQNYREKRKQSLEKLAKNLILKVKKTRQPKVLEPMNPYERKIIHTIIQDDPDVNAISLGDGAYKRLKLFLKKND